MKRPERAWVLMTAMPPTTGHLDLIRFAAAVADRAHVVVCTQPGEPYCAERVAALREATADLPVTVHHLDRTIQQEPIGDDPAFWAMWRRLLTGFGLTPGRDCVVASEAYGAQLARECGVEWFPYDLARVLNPAKATGVRDDVAGGFRDVLPAFQPVLRRRVTVFGAESTGKTTLSRALAAALDARWVFEYARPYQEAPGIGGELTEATMRGIWTGQRALQDNAAARAEGQPFIVQDTDLFTTLGYWQMWRPETVPADLALDAAARTSDLYLVLTSAIPFEPDPLRYGGDHREIPDARWLEVCERHHLPFVVLDSPDHEERLRQAVDACRGLIDTSLASYRRQGAEYSAPAVTTPERVAG